MSYRVLIVDDEDDIRDILNDTLTAKGFTVDTACEGNEGLEKYLANEYDAVLSDVNMPNGMDGFTFCKRMQENPKTPQPLVFIMTGYLDNFDTVNEYPIIHTPIKKPFSGLKIAKQIKQILDENK